jgi:NADH:ubiquinone oxidoreductase subunit 5 (subunit L)/multisubunit Na+/H+ antiporter MnhA subunit
MTLFNKEKLKFIHEIPALLLVAMIILMIMSIASSSIGIKNFNKLPEYKDKNKSNSNYLIINLSINILITIILIIFIIYKIIN